MSRLDRLLPSERWQRRATRAMELSLVGLLFVGIERGNPGIIVNTVVALGVFQLPAVLERDYEMPMDARLTLWISAAAFLHALGTVGVPGMGWTFYKGLGWWDHMTHSLSASVVAAAGYATVRAVDIHSEDVYVPPRFASVIILIFVLAFGVLWELLEFGIAVAAEEVGTATVLTQFGAEDTLKDLTFNTMGGLVVAIWGGIYLSDLSSAISQRFDGE